MCTEPVRIWLYRQHCQLKTTFLSLTPEGSAGGATNKLFELGAGWRPEPHSHDLKNHLSHLLLDAGARRGCGAQGVPAHLLQVRLSTRPLQSVPSPPLFLSCMFPSIPCVLSRRECLRGTILTCADAEVSCPEECEMKLVDREIKAVSVSPADQLWERWRDVMPWLKGKHCGVAVLDLNLDSNPFSFGKSYLGCVVYLRAITFDFISTVNPLQYVSTCKLITCTNS